MVTLARIGQLPVRYWLLVLPTAVAAGVVMGIPTAMIPNPLFERMIPADPFNYLFWVLTSVLFGLIGATYLTPGLAAIDVQNKAAGGGLLSVFAVGCPICNKLVVFALGVSGALTYFAPLQPLIGLASVALLIYALRLRFQQMGGACPVR